MSARLQEDYMRLCLMTEPPFPAPLNVKNGGPANKRSKPLPSRTIVSDFDQMKQGTDFKKGQTGPPKMTLNDPLTTINEG